MKNWIKRGFLVTLLGLLATCNIHSRPVVTYTFSYGRLGDDLISYLHAKWVAYKHNISLRYKPFKWSNLLNLHATELPYKSSFREKTLKAKEEVEVELHSDVCYVIPYFPEAIREFDKKWYWDKYPYFEIDWSDLAFRSEIKKKIAPLKPMKLIPVPSDKIAVAVHVRKGTGFDLPLLHEQKEVDGLDLERIFNLSLPTLYADVYFPLKHCPDEYYIDQIRYISEHFNHSPLYVFLLNMGRKPHGLLSLGMNGHLYRGS